MVRFIDEGERQSIDAREARDVLAGLKAVSAQTLEFTLKGNETCPHVSGNAFNQLVRALSNAFMQDPELRKKMAKLYLPVQGNPVLRAIVQKASLKTRPNSGLELARHMIDKYALPDDLGARIKAESPMYLFGRGAIFDSLRRNAQSVPRKDHYAFHQVEDSNLPSMYFSLSHRDDNFKRGLDVSIGGNSVEHRLTIFDEMLANGFVNTLAANSQGNETDMLRFMGVAILFSKHIFNNEIFVEKAEPLLRVDPFQYPFRMA